MNAQKTWEIYNPVTAGNPISTGLLCVIRSGGWLVDQMMFSEKDKAQTWAENHSGEMSHKIAAVYVTIEKEKEAKQ